MDGAAGDHGRGDAPARARRLADFIVTARRDNPDPPIYLMGYSCGAFVALRALELLPPDVQVDAAVFLAAAFDPDHDMTAALSRVRGRIVNCSSALDCLIIGAGTCLFGTAERTFGPSAGMVGLRTPPCATRALCRFDGGRA